jgi:hypothetical protein
VVHVARAAPAVGGDPDRSRFALTGLAALVAIAAAQFGDLATFLRMIAIGGFGAEANPIVVHLGSTLGLEALVAAKLLLIPFAAVIVAVLARVRVGLAASVLTFATVTGLVGAFSNVFALV